MVTSFLVCTGSCGISDIHGTNIPTAENSRYVSAVPEAKDARGHNALPWTHLKGRLVITSPMAQVEVGSVFTIITIRNNYTTRMKIFRFQYAAKSSYRINE